jgi:AcrR family transcriptional regulator
LAPRTRTTADTAIAQFAADLLIEAGPARVTFAEVGTRCGLAPPTLVQRFGTRSGLLAAVANALAARLPGQFADPVDPLNWSPLVGLRACLIGLAPTVQAAAQLAAEADLSAFTRELHKQISYRLAIAVEAGELPRCDVAQLARTLQIHVAGAVVIARMAGSDVANEVGAAIDMQLASYV